jgi:hypothetical protein
MECARLGKVKTGTVCSVQGCDEKATRSVSAEKAREGLQAAGAGFEDNRARRLYLCQKHYKVYKKQTKKDKKVDKWRYGA